ncbi:hypothetical protein A2U01_0117191, partial [Trifolium medium]|nr:hypothetical protein [Trifolium medium]
MAGIVAYGGNAVDLISVAADGSSWNKILHANNTMAGILPYWSRYNLGGPNLGQPKSG